MTDFLLLDSPGHGPWFWDGVKGAIENKLRNQSDFIHLNYQPGKILAPENLSNVNSKYTTLNEYAMKTIDQINQAGLTNPIIVSHSFSGILTLELCNILGKDIKELIFIGSIIPDMFRTSMEMIPIPLRLLLITSSILTGNISFDTIKMHREFVLKILCSDIPYPEASMAIGRLNPLNAKLLDMLANPESFEKMPDSKYVVLNKSRLLPSNIQSNMANYIKASTIKVPYGQEAPFFYPEIIAEILLQQTQKPIRNY